jgi:hypothetical protein
MPFPLASFGTQIAPMILRAFLRMPIELPIGRTSLSTTHTPTRLHKYANQRRSQRVMLSIRILVSGIRIGGQSFSEETLTSVVNAHGALILLGENVSNGQSLTIRNVKSGEELQGEVVDVGAEQAGKFEVGVEFLEASPRFWRIAFPPEDWSPRNPEAKRAVIPTAPVALPKPRVSK